MRANQHALYLNKCSMNHEVLIVPQTHTHTTNKQNQRSSTRQLVNMTGLFRVDRLSFTEMTIQPVDLLVSINSSFNGMLFDEMYFFFFFFWQSGNIRPKRLSTKCPHTLLIRWIFVGPNVMELLTACLQAGAELVGAGEEKLSAQLFAVTAVNVPISMPSLVFLRKRKSMLRGCGQSSTPRSRKFDCLKPTFTAGMFYFWSL